MARSGSIERHRLFHHFAKSFAAHFPGHEELFVCPLCFKAFDSSALEKSADGQKPLLSIEHIPPERVGGRIRTLTCSECNGTAGSTMDAHLVNKLKFMDSISGIGNEPLAARIRVPGSEKELAVNCLIRADGGPDFQFFGVPRASHRDAPDEMRDALISKQPFKVTFNGKHIEFRTRLSLLRAAYLLMFHYFGYGYLRYATAEAVRDQIKRYQDDLLGPSVILPLERPLVAGAANQICAITNPVELRCFMVSLVVVSAQDRHFGVVLPGLDDDSSEVYSRWAALGEQRTRRTFSAIHVPYDASYVSNAEMSHTAMGAWTDVIRLGYGFDNGTFPPGIEVPSPAVPRLVYRSIDIDQT